MDKLKRDPVEKLAPSPWWRPVVIVALWPREPVPGLTAGQCADGQDGLNSDSEKALVEEATLHKAGNHAESVKAQAPRPLQ
jgi:hypothetical protein